MSERDPTTRWGLAILAVLACIPLIMWVQACLHERAVERETARRDAVDVTPGGGGVTPDGPTIGMTLDADGMGNLIEAPEAVAQAATPTNAGKSAPGVIAADLRPYVRGLPVPATSRLAAEPMMCTLEGPPSWTGRLVLVKGCLRLQNDGEPGPGPLILGSTELHRDTQGYLVASVGHGDAQGTIRVGAPNVTFTGVGCSMDGPVPAPITLAKACGVSTMRRIGRMERRRYCTPEDTSREAQRRADNAAMQARLAAMRQQCLDRGTDPRACPPGVGPVQPPLPAPGSIRGCVPPPRYPRDLPRQLSSTQP